MRFAVFAAEHPAGTMTRAIARAIAARGLFGFQHEIKRNAKPAAKLPAAAGPGAEFVMAEVQGKTHLGNLDAAELEAADRVPLADRRPAVAAGRRAAARAGMKHVPDEIASGSRVFTLDRDPEAPAPSRHRALRAGRRQCLDDGFD